MVEKWPEAPNWSGVSAQEKKAMLAKANERALAALAANEPKAIQATASGVLGMVLESEAVVIGIGDAGSGDDAKRSYFVPAHT